MKIMDYQYTSGISIESPPQYQRSPFEGKNFIRKYIQNRENTLAKNINNEDNEYKKIKQIISNQKSLEINLKDDKINTIKILKYLCFCVITDKIDNNIKYLIDKFVKKYEVNKKLYYFYGQDIIEHSKDFANVEAYVLLSLLCIMFYKKNLKLKYLNTVLKLNDVLLLEIKRSNTENQMIFDFVIRQEIKLVISLLKNKGIKI